jgi:hypothetical protein
VGAVVLLKGRLRIRNADPKRALVVRVWHRSNAFMSDGDSPWLDGDGTPTSERSHDHAVPAGETLALEVREELAFTVLTDGTGPPKGLTDAVRDFLRTGSTDPDGHAGTALFSLTNETAGPLRVRVFASATFQFSPLWECSLSAGQAADLSTGEAGISVRVG